MTKISKVRTRTQAPGLRSSYVRLSLFQKILLTLGILIAVLTTLPVMVVLLIGLLPTFTVMVTDRNNTNKLIIVGCFNLAGVFIYLFHVISNFTVRDAFFILSDIFNLIIMLGSAGLGLIVYLEVPNLFIYLSKIAAQKRLKTLDANLEKLRRTGVPAFSETAKNNAQTKKTAATAAVFLNLCISFRQKSPSGFS